MGDRISISFATEDEESVALFNHWGGTQFIETVKNYLYWLEKQLLNRKDNIVYPIDRLEPSTVMVDFIRWLTKDEDLVYSNLYLGKDKNDGDNSDNGHVKIVLRKGESDIIATIH